MTLAPPIPATEWQPRLRLVVASFALGTVALLILGIQPILLGALVAGGALTEAGVGRLATAEILLLALGSGTGPWLQSSGRIASAALASAAALVVTNAITPFVHAESALLALRAVAGLAEGIMLAAGLVVMTNMRDPDRVNGLFFAVATIPQALAGYALPALLMPLWAGAGFMFLALCALVALAFSFSMDQRVPTPVQHVVVERNAFTGAVILACIGVVLQNAGIGAAWTYFDRIGAQHGFDGDFIGLCLAASLVAQVIASSFVAWFGWKLPFRPVLILGAALQATLSLLLAWSSDQTIFLAGAIFFGVLWLGLMPFYLKLVITLDNTRTVALLLMLVGLAGVSAGPLVASFFVVPGNVTPAFIIAATMFALATISYGLAFLVAQKTVAAGTSIIEEGRS